ncbi:MAG: hypothetical protein JNM90_12070 [Burkholderiales bacterium]|nr:hypothetical protein [Burkholderiales bacterium]
MLRVLIWSLLAWPLPAVLAGALGWRGIWGSGSAFVDYLIPLPVAGGALHVPSFVLAGVAVAMLPAAGSAAAARLRALLAGTALAGVLLLLDLGELGLAAATGATPAGSLWQQNPLGLFLACDAATALVCAALAPQRPWLRADAASAALALAPLALPLGLVLGASGTGAAADFLPGASRDGAVRGDAIALVFTRLDTQAPDFRARAEAWAAPLHPRLSVNSEDVAILFTRDLDAARRFEADRAAATLCLYEDGTPARWLAGSRADDCFDGHVSFSERLAAAYAARPDGEPAELRTYAARAAVCVGVTPLPASGDTGGLELAPARICSGLPEARAALKARFPDAVLP